ncbi:MAG TPA: S8 family serine peptidase [Longimicrobium sp.]|jgi:subtilisin family serine protease|nr:S8 family serine peptidase [Longimicrobium sp.]
MKRYTLLSALLAAGTLAGCADVAGPAATAAPPSPAHSLAAGNGQHVVVFKGNGIPAGFAAEVAALGGTVTYAHAGVGFAIVSGLGDAAASQVGRLGGVSGVQADEVFQLESSMAAEADFELAAASQANPASAARHAFQWNMRLINADDAWAAGKLGSPGVTVAILDSGLDYDAPDLNGLVDLSRSASFVPSDDAITAAYFPNRHPINDYNGHGTNVATQVSSKAVALAGVTSRTTLIGVKVLGWNNFGSLAGVLAGITWAADQGADVANMSLGGVFAKTGSGAFVGLIHRTLAYANQQGMLIVTSAGNGPSDLDHDGNAQALYCSVPHVLCVSSVGPATGMLNQDAPAFYTNFGRSAISVAAPGGNADAAGGFPVSPRPWGNDFASWVWSLCAKYRIAGFTATGAPVLTQCIGGNGLRGLLGTSQASPHVAGLAALLIAEHGYSNQPAALKHAIEQSALDLGPVGTDPYYGRGRIDVARALGL